VPTAVLRLVLERLNFLVAAQKRPKEKKDFMHIDTHPRVGWAAGKRLVALVDLPPIYRSPIVNTPSKQEEEHCNQLLKGYGRILT
jgi:hypothetical protein